jgi:2',3'-cyclic-nucleotide 2'-phosphodiesterase (5'-nucleotidase family)
MGWTRLGGALLVAGVVLGTAALPASGQEAVEITLLHDSHFHGKYGDDEVPREACPGGAPPAGFEDVSPDSVHLDTIACATSLDVVRGTGDDPPRFSPDLPATRGQIAALIARLLDAAGVALPEDPEQPFDDVEGSVHADDIARLSEADVLEGRDGSFFPQDPVRRDQMASILIRALEFATDTTITPDGGPHFDDVQSGPHAANVDAAFELGLMLGRTSDLFDPRSETRRDQVASTVVRLLDHLALLDATGLVNLSRYLALVAERKAALGASALYLGNGDDIAPSLHSGVFEPHGIHMIEALNAAADLIDVNNLGNHEFDYGPGNLELLLAEAEYPYVSANVRDIDSGEVFGVDLGVQEYVILDVEGVQVGITGLGPENMASITDLGDDTEQIPAADALDIVLPQMRDDGADIIVISSHLCGPDAIELADTYTAHGGIDVIAGDHCAAVELYESPQTGTIVSLAGDEFELLAELTLTVEGGAVTAHQRVLHDLAADFPLIEPHPGVQAVMDGYNAQLDDQLNVVIGERTVEWDTRTSEVRAFENAFGNFLTDEMRAFYDADIAVQNSGGIRANTTFPPGDITRREIAEILPFGNHIVLAELTGATILEALEHSVHGWGDGNGRFLQVSGLRFTFDVSRPAGDRVVEVEIGGEPLDEGATYTMATNNFTLAGGDDFTMFEDATVLVDANEGPMDAPWLMERIAARDTPVDTTDDEGRINRIGD